MSQAAAKIIGTGAYLPQQIITNADLEKKIDTTDAWIVERTGIKQRHIISGDETTTTMAVAAARQALLAASLQPNDLGAIIVATCTADAFVPNTACAVQRALGVTNACMAFDLNAACSGFLYGLHLIDQLLKGGRTRTVLLIGVEAMSRLLNWQDRSTCVLFGDGAGAAILTVDTKPGLYSVHLHADGTNGDLLRAPTAFISDAPYVHMQGGDVFKMAVNALEQVVLEGLAANQMTMEQLDWLVPHQANSRIVIALAKKLNFSLDRVILTVDRQANTSAASIPLALHTAIADGRIQRGQQVLMAAFGAGFTWGSALLRY